MKDPVSNEKTNKQNQRVSTLLYKPCVPSFICIGRIKYSDQKATRERRVFFQLSLQVSVDSGEKSRQEPELIACPHSITSDHETHLTAIEVNQEPLRI